MTPAQSKALIEAVFDLRNRMQHVEAILEGMHAAELERLELLKQLKLMTEHSLRLMRQKEDLLARVGRFTVEQQFHIFIPPIAADSEAVEFMANVRRATEEIQRATGRH